LAQFNLQTGREGSIPTAKKEGTVYFAVDTVNNIGKIFYDHTASRRVNIVPDLVDCGSWNVIDLGYKDPNCCFVAGTQILCDLSGNSKSIEEITAGDSVISYNIFTKEWYSVVVQKLIINRNTTHLAIVTLDNGVVLQMNAYHPIYTIDGFHSITNHDDYPTLIVGDQVVCTDGVHSIVSIIEEDNTDKPLTTYNLATKNWDESIDDDTYDTFVANGCVVHNANCPV
jgi:hypothetical protein